MDERLKDGMFEFTVKSSYDGTEQPNLFLPANSKEPRPLLVGLHTWSFDRFNQIGNMTPYAKACDFHLLLPEFRGPNTKGNPRCKSACASEAARRDIIDAIEWAKKEYAIDESAIILLGHSGGGHMALMMAAHYPKLFRAVGAFVPICDLKLWHTEAPGYAPHIEACCGDGDEMLRRSPITYLDTLAEANVKIFHGKFDSCVPVTQSLGLFAEMMAKYPKCKCYLDIFDGGHQLDMKAAAAWFASQLGKNNLVSVTG